LFFPNSFDKNVERSLTFDFLKLLKEIENCKMLIVGLSNNLKNLDPFIRKKFNEEILIDVLNNEERLEMIQYLSKEYPISDTFHFKDLNSKCFGYSSQDIQLIYKMAFQHTKIRSGEFIEMKDFESVMSSFKPLSLKFSISLPEIPKVFWKDIGGVEETKKKLEEMIIFPIIHKEKYKMMGISPPVGILFFGPPGKENIW
jgi:transitional endoplasmic reticulum ATPase